ncbi:MAG: DnaJ C-terminal domain-containing protein [Opitutaceae bacterium]
MSSDYKDYYAVLGVEKTASQDAIKKGFRKLARKFHPDVTDSFNQAASDAKFKEANEAYEVLGDPEKRKRYDTLGANWQQAGPQASGAGVHPGGGQSRTAEEFNFSGTGFSDFFEQYFAGGEGARRGGFANQGRSAHDFSRRGNDVEAEISVSFEEVVQGANRDISLVKTDSATRQETTHRYQVKIPKGIKEGQRIRLAGQGEAGTGTGAAGDLFLRVRYLRHPFLRNENEKLYYDLELAPWEAVLGTAIDIRVLDATVKVKIPSCSQNRQQLRLRGLGLPDKAGVRGDLYVNLLIELPKSADAEELKHWEALSNSSKFKPRGD